METVMIILIAFVLDFLFGDPAWLPHPIRLIGFFIAKGEKLLRRLFPKTKGGETAAGAVLAVCVPALTFGLCWLLLFAAESIHIYLRYAVETLLCYQIFAARSLKDESMRVYRIPKTLIFRRLPRLWWRRWRKTPLMASLPPCCLWS